MNFDLNDFRLILNIAETQNLTRAAERSFISTPAASHRIKQLEQQLGLKVLRRSTQGVELTEIGLIYLKYARSIAQELECLRGDLAQFNQHIQGTLSIVANTTAITEYIPHALSEYLVTHPQVDVNLQEMLSEDIVERVSERRADLGIISGNIDTKNLKTQDLISSKLILIAPKNHPILVHDRVKFSIATGYPVVTLREGSAIQLFLNKIAQDIGQRLTVRVQVSSYDSICQMVATGAGISIIPYAAFQRLQNIHPTLAYRQIDEDWAERSFKICAIDFNALSQFARDFMTCLTENVA